MQRRLHLVVPSVFLEAPPRPPDVLPIPGNVTLADLTPKSAPFPSFLIPWKPFKDRPHHAVGSCIDEGKDENALPVEISPSHHDAYLDAYDVEGAMSVVFRHRLADVPRVMRSLRSPFRSSGCDDDIVWTMLQRVGRANPSNLGGKKLKDRHKYFTKGPPWSVFSVGCEGVILKNYIYDGDGNVCAEVDFGHQTVGSVHFHGLVEGSMDHSSTADEDHALPWIACPWFWLAFPDLRRTGANPEHGMAEWGPPSGVDEVKKGVFRWVSVSLSYEDLLGERQFSDDW